MRKAEYRLTLTSDQARAISKATELLMRLKIGQYEEIPFAVMDLGSERFAHKRDVAKPLLKSAFDFMAPDEFGGGWEQDEEWHRLYGIHQVIRHAIQQAEHPSSKGVDSYEPYSSGGEPLPQIEIIK